MFLCQKCQTIEQCQITAGSMFLVPCSCGHALTVSMGHSSHRYMKEAYPNFQDQLPDVSDLQEFYKASKTLGLNFVAFIDCRSGRHHTTLTQWNIVQILLSEVSWCSARIYHTIDGGAIRSDCASVNRALHLGGFAAGSLELRRLGPECNFDNTNVLSLETSNRAMVSETITALCIGGQ